MAPSAAADRGIWVVPALLRPAPVPQVPDPGAGGCVQLQGATLCGGFVCRGKQTVAIHGQCILPK